MKVRCRSKERKKERKEERERERERGRESNSLWLCMNVKKKRIQMPISSFAAI